MISREKFELEYVGGIKYVLKFLLSRGLTTHQAEEVAQIAWTKAYEKRDTLDNDSKIIPWVMSISWNTFLVQCRRKRFIHEDIDKSSIESLLVFNEDHDTSIQVKDLLNNLSSNDSQILQSFYMLGNTSEELSKEYNCALSTVRVRTSRARQRAKKLLINVNIKSKPLVTK